MSIEELECNSLFKPDASDCSRIGLGVGKCLEVCRAKGETDLPNDCLSVEEISQRTRCITQENTTTQQVKFVPCANVYNVVNVSVNPEIL